ncbi:MAG: hypothetical protein HC923_11660, partial [Myxococcales bacterium]|nr:hypothetical protein [Myxococcales bacterium]
LGIGEQRLVAIADCRNVLTEPLEGDNTGSALVDVFAAGPDLRLVWTSTAGPAESGADYPLAFRLENLGSAATNAQVRLRLQSPGASTSIDVLPAPVAIGADEGRSFVARAPLPEDLPSGRYLATLEARVVGGTPDVRLGNEVEGPRDVDVDGFAVAIVGPDAPPATLGRPYVWSSTPRAGTPPTSGPWSGPTVRRRGSASRATRSRASRRKLEPLAIG